MFNTVLSTQSIVQGMFVGYISRTRWESLKRSALDTPSLKAMKSAASKLFRKLR